MRKLLKGAGLSLCAMLMLVGCSCKKEEKDTKANISNPTESIVSGLKKETKSITLQKIYDDLKMSEGNTVAANKLLELIADLVFSGEDAETWESRYNAKVQEKLNEFIENSGYQVDGIFDEELLVKTLRSQLYTITCTNDNYGPIYTDGEISDYMICNYEDYVNKALKVEILTELLNEKYIYEKVMKDKETILATKKARLVEYVAIDYASDDEEDKVIEHIEEAVKALAESTKTLKEIADEWTEKKIQEIVDKFNKIGTKDDSNGSIFSEFTNKYTQPAEKGLEQKKQEVYAVSNYDSVVITSDSNDILNSTLVERILSENVLTESAKKTTEINGSYYLVAPWAGNSISSSDIRIKDSTNNKYYIVRVEVIDDENIATDVNVQNKVYEAVKVLATNTSLVSDSVSYFLEQHKEEINVHDEEIYTYLKTRYSNIFVD